MQYLDIRQALVESAHCLLEQGGHLKAKLWACICTYIYITLPENTSANDSVSFNVHLIWYHRSINEAITHLWCQTPSVAALKKLEEIENIFSIKWKSGFFFSFWSIDFSTTAVRFAYLIWFMTMHLQQSSNSRTSLQHYLFFPPFNNTYKPDI